MEGKHRKGLINDRLEVQSDRATNGRYNRKRLPNNWKKQPGKIQSIVRFMSQERAAISLNQIATVLLKMGVAAIHAEHKQRIFLDL